MIPASKDETRQRAYHHGNLRAAILTAACDVLRTQEPSAVSLRDLARTVGVRHSALYVHFRDRNALLAAVASQGFQELLKEMRAALARQGTSLDALAVTYLEFARTNPAYYRTMFLPEVGKPENADQLKEACDACFDTLMEVLADVSPTIEERHERAVGIWSTLHGLALLGDNSGPLHNQISPDREAAMARKIVHVLSTAAWPKDAR